jgi:hypothetical protein
MPARSGRLEKRIRLAVPIQISAPADPSASERTTTENVSVLGVRALVRRAWDLNERVIISSPSGNTRAAARVVYCQRTTGERFAIGLEFLGALFNWSKELTAGSAD